MKPDTVVPVYNPTLGSLRQDLCGIQGKPELCGKFQSNLVYQLKPSLIGTIIVEGDNQLLEILWPPHVCAGKHTDGEWGIKGEAKRSRELGGRFWFALLA